MNYNHSFHAGNAADVLKHAVLARCITYLLRKNQPFRYIDTHAGIGVYDLQGSEASRTGEAASGVQKLMSTRLSAGAEAVLEPYRAVLETFVSEGGLRYYPGSPEIVRRLARPQDRLTLVEMAPEPVARLKGRYRSDDRVRVVALDGWTALPAFVPPNERRGLVLVDPPFEEPGELSRLRDGLAAAYRKWPGGTYLLWYPIKDVLDSERFSRDIAGLGIPDIVRVEVLQRRPQDSSLLNGSGLIAVNPPWMLIGELRALLPDLANLLADGPGARGRVDQLTGENAGQKQDR